MKVKLPRELFALLMLVMGLVFVSAIFEQSPIIIAAICVIWVMCGVYVHFSVIQRGDYADYDVIG